jgi:hypothetical protein
MGEPKDDESGSGWSISIGRTRCSECDTPKPVICFPKSLHELIWRGWTCRNCGCRLDKWGQARSP